MSEQHPEATGQRIGHKEAMAYFREFGYTGYKIGQILRLAEDVVIVEQVDFSRTEDDQDAETELSRRMFPDNLELVPGMRYSIAHEIRDRGGYSPARDSSTMVTVYGVGENESDSLHATLFPVPGPLGRLDKDPDAEPDVLIMHPGTDDEARLEEYRTFLRKRNKASVHDHTNGRGLTPHGRKLIERILPRRGINLDVTITEGERRRHK